MHLLHLFLATITFGSILVEAAASNYDAFISTVWPFPLTDYADGMLMFARHKLRGDHPHSGFRDVVDSLFYGNQNEPADERAVDLVILNRVLEIYGHLIGPGEKWWLKHILNKRIAAEDVDAVRIVLEHFHEF